MDIDCQIKELVLSVNSAFVQLDDNIDAESYDDAMVTCAGIIEDIREFMFTLHELRIKQED